MKEPGKQDVDTAAADRIGGGGIEGASSMIRDESSGRGVVEPVFGERTNAKDEARHAARWLRDRHRVGYAWREMVVLAPGKRNWRDPIVDALVRDGIPFRMLLGDPTIAPDPAGDHVHVMTLHAVAPLAFPVVAVLGIGDLPWKSQTLDEATRLVEVAMTRATGALMVSHSKPSVLVGRLLAIRRATSP